MSVSYSTTTSTRSGPLLSPHQEQTTTAPAPTTPTSTMHHADTWSAIASASSLPCPPLAPCSSPEIPPSSPPFSCELHRERRGARGSVKPCLRWRCQCRGKTGKEAKGRGTMRGGGHRSSVENKGGRVEIFITSTIRNTTVSPPRCCSSASIARRRAFLTHHHS